MLLGVEFQTEVEQADNGARLWRSFHLKPAPTNFGVRMPLPTDIFWCKIFICNYDFNENFLLLSFSNLLPYGFLLYYMYSFLLLSIFCETIFKVLIFVFALYSVEYIRNSVPGLWYAWWQSIFVLLHMRSSLYCLFAFVSS